MDTHKFAKTFCSQCGGEFGPGDAGYSHCDQHDLKTMARLIFEGGSIGVRINGYPNNGDGEFLFDEEEADWGDTKLRIVKVPKSELIALRDFLDKWLAE
jgi:hypothetical protein